ncbi:hypothetical protein BB561_004313 [Smittium simulii]|uniref:Autophagy-related protein 16 domain-containing protein n=1 Tax=Smittium simulii TaxID=133385 RepID=A0A2T9YH13_9FUNG|nr:hypothetical protein BB561_004313 [Smittium simulii]
MDSKKLYINSNAENKINFAEPNSTQIKGKIEHKYNNKLYKTPEAAIDALLIKKAKEGYGAQNFASKDIFLSKISKLLETERSLNKALGEKLTSNELQIEELEKKNLLLKTQLEEAKSKIELLYLERVSTDDFQEICKANQELRDELNSKDSLLKECEELIAEFVSKQ